MEHVQKKVGKNTVAAISHSLKHDEGRGSFQFKDNRPEAVNQLKLQNIADNSLHVKQLQVCQTMADNNARNNKTVQMNGDEEKKAPAEGSLRPALGRSLMQNLMGPNWFATGVFKAMNFAMYMEGQPLAPEHDKVLNDSLITNRKGILDTLIAENPYVMKSSGKTPIYLLGKNLVHRPLEYYIKHRSDKGSDE